MSELHPSVVILAGPNGAGKSTVAPALLHGTLAVSEFAPWLRNLRASGYEIHLLFLWLPSADFAVERVAERVRAGGHNVAAETVRRRYRAGLRNFFSLYEPLASAWKVYDSSGLKPALIAERLEAQPLRVYDEAAWTLVKRQGTA